MTGCGAHHVFNDKPDDVAAEIAKLTGGRGVDFVIDATYREQGVETAKTVRQGGNWIVLGVGPGKTTRLAERGAKHVNVNLLRYFSEPFSSVGWVWRWSGRRRAVAYWARWR